MNINIDLSDDVSALSMDGASAIAMNINFARRLTRDAAAAAASNNNMIQPRIPEDEERPVATIIVVDENEIIQSCDADEDHQTNDGKKLIEEFPTSPEVRRKRREKKHKQKSKLLGDHQSKTGSICGSSNHRVAESGHHEPNRNKHSKSKRHGKKSSTGNGGLEHQHQIAEHEIIGESSRTLPTSEISFQSTSLYTPNSEPATPPRNYASRDQKRGSDFLSYPSIVSTVDSDNSRSANHDQRCPSLLHRDRNSTGAGSTRSLHSLTHHDPPSESIPSRTNNRLSQSDRESMTITTEHSAHTSGLHSCANQSNFTVEDIHRLHTKLRRARKEEKQVLRIHEQLVEEVRSAKTREADAMFHQQQVSLLFEAATLEQEQLQKYLSELQNENTKLGVILSKLEESEDERSFIAMLDDMHAKMKSYKVKSRKL